MDYTDSGILQDVLTSGGAAQPRAMRREGREYELQTIWCGSHSRPPRLTVTGRFAAGAGRSAPAEVLADRRADGVRNLRNPRNPWMIFLLCDLCGLRGSFLS